jgi:hypothetical protein
LNFVMLRRSENDGATFGLSINVRRRGLSC